MNKQLVTNWLNALPYYTNFNKTFLLSGTDKIMCPLGILCNVSELGEWKLVTKDFLTPDDNVYTYVIDEEENITTPRGTTILPVTLQKELCFPTSVGSFTVKNSPKVVQDTLKRALKYPMERCDIASLPSICSPVETIVLIEALMRQPEAFTLHDTNATT